MSYKVCSIPLFDKQAKRLAKKYSSLKVEFGIFLEDLKKDPKQGVPIGNNCYKVRISIASKGKGKSGGGRVITNVYVEKNTVYLLTIFDKAEQENISQKELSLLLKEIKR